MIDRPHREDIDSAKVLLRICDIRSRWIPRYPEIEPASVIQNNTPKIEGLGTNEPDYDPYNVKPLPKIDAEYVFHKGKLQIYWSAPEGRAEVKIEGPQRAIGEVPASPTNKLLDVQPGRPPRRDRTWRNGKPLLWLGRPIPSVRHFLKDLKTVMEATQNPVMKTFAFRRLKYLESRFGMHVLFNSVKELDESKQIHHRDFYNVRKVDTHIHHSACMHQKHLLRFIRHKYRKEGEVVVAKDRDGNGVTLKEIFARELGFSAWEASLDHLDVQALCSCFQRFDIFNNKYNPFGERSLRDVFLKTDNFIGGRYLAELTLEVIEDLEAGKYQHAEWRVSVYGRSKSEWATLGKWMRKYNLTSKRVRWMIQVPRLYHVYKGLGIINNFADMLTNIFEPIVQALIDPDTHEDVWFALQQIIGWDCVDDESRQSKFTSEGGELPPPDKWTAPHNPPYSYYLYHMYANIRAINELLVVRGMRAHQFRPHCGEAGSPSHLATAYLVADSINHGIVLRKAPVLTYLYYLKQIGLAVSPISNNALFLELAKNPFPYFHKLGLNVSLSTDDPLMFHFTSEPLLEEYSIAAHTWKFSPVDMCEIARNSVIQSGFEPQFKRHWLGPSYLLPGKKGNSPLHSNVPNLRLQYRWDTLQEEFRYLISIYLASENAATMVEKLPSTLSAVLTPHQYVMFMIAQQKQYQQQPQVDRPPSPALTLKSVTNAQHDDQGSTTNNSHSREGASPAQPILSISPPVASFSPRHSTAIGVINAFSSGALSSHGESPLLLPQTATASPPTLPSTPANPGLVPHPRVVTGRVSMMIPGAEFTSPMRHTISHHLDVSHFNAANNEGFLSHLHQPQDLPHSDDNESGETPVVDDKLLNQIVREIRRVDKISGNTNNTFNASSSSPLKSPPSPHNQQLQRKSSMGGGILDIVTSNSATQGLHSFNPNMSIDAPLPGNRSNLNNVILFGKAAEGTNNAEETSKMKKSDSSCADLSVLARALNQEDGVLTHMNTLSLEHDNSSLQDSQGDIYDKKLLEKAIKTNDDFDDVDEDEADGHSELADSDDEEDGNAWRSLHEHTKHAEKRTDANGVMHMPAAPSGKLI